MATQLDKGNVGIAYRSRHRVMTRSGTTFDEWGKETFMIV